MKLSYILFGCVLIGFAFMFYAPHDSHSTAITPPPAAPVKMLPADPWVNAIQSPATHQVLNEYESFIQTSLANHAAPGAAIAIIQDTSIIFLKGFGIRDAVTGDLVGIHSVFRIGSVSKCFASTLTGLLVDEKYFGFDDPVKKYVPGFRLKTEEHTNGLTLRHVLSHTTGLPYHAFTDRVDDGANYDTLAYHLRDLDLLGKPGQLYSYQNVGYSLISDVIQSATHRTYAQNLDEKVFKKLHMESASTSYEAIMQNKDVASPHRFNGAHWVRYPISSTYYNVAPAGGVNASISDMALWMRAMVGQHNGFISPETREQLFLPVVRATARNNYFWRWKPVKSAWYAMGWRVLKFRDDTVMYHGGFVNGYRAEVAFNLKSKVGICVLVNSTGGLADASVPKFFEIYRRHKNELDAEPVHKP